jgi:hypothetical protein
MIARVPEPIFTDGPAISPSGPLLDWLNAAAETGPGRLVRLPAVLRLDALSLGIGSATVGTGARESAGGGGNPVIHLTLNDDAMGVPLFEQVSWYRGEQQRAVWLTGHWGRPGRAFRQEGLPEPGGGLRVLFSPARVAGKVSPGALPHETRAGIEM